MTNVVVLESTLGREVAVANNVPNAELVTCFNKFCDAAAVYAAPVVFVNGKGYTNRNEFMQMVHTVNQFSTYHGGRQVY